MKPEWHTLTIDVRPGMDIETAIRKAQELSRDHRGKLVTFDFNGVDVTVARDSNADLIRRDYERACEGFISYVNAHPAELTDEEKERESRIRSERNRKAQEKAERYAQESDKSKATVLGKISVTPIQVTDTSGWNEMKSSNKDAYGARVVQFSEHWARLMQIEFAAGKRLEDVADDCAREADYDGITGFMYGCAVGILSKVWTHGDELRRWHNLKTQIGVEGERANESGGTLNPAVLTIGGSEDT